MSADSAEAAGIGPNWSRSGVIKVIVDEPTAIVVQPQLAAIAPSPDHTGIHPVALLPGGIKQTFKTTFQNQTKRSNIFEP